jgi:nicotinate dehydrogenase subunit B
MNWLTRQEKIHLKDERAKAVLIKLREMAGKQPKIAVAQTGIAFSRYKNTAAYCAVAATVSFSKEKDQFIIHKMFSVIDAGEAINPDGLINQTEGGMIQSASWTMQEEVKFNHEFILSTDWKTYPIFRFSQVPETEVVVLNNPENGPMGAGEAAQGPAGAAVANAVARVTGKRYRDLPIAPVPLPES